MKAWLSPITEISVDAASSSFDVRSHLSGTWRK